MSDPPAEGSDARRRSSFLRAAVGTYGTNLAVAVLSLLNVLIVARVLGAEGRGDVAFLIAISLLASFLGALGIQDANGNIAGLDPSARPSLATNSLLFALGLGSVVALVIAGLVVVFPAVGGDVSRTLLWIVLTTIPIGIVRLYLNYLVQADYHFAITNVTWLAGPVTTLLANGLLAIVGHLTVSSAIAAWIAGQLIGVGILVAFVARRIGFGRPSLRLAVSSVSFGSKVHLGHTLAIGNYRLDQWLLGSMVGSRELGLYSVAVAWGEVLFYLPGVLVMIQRPDLVRASAERAVELAQRVVRVAVVLAVVLAAALVLLAPFLCTVLFGDEFAGSVDDLRVLAVGAVGICLMELLGGALNARRRPLLTTAASACAFVLTITLDLLLIPPLGGLGAAIATSVAWTVGGLVVAIMFTRAMGSPARGLVPGRADVRWIRAELRQRLDARRA
jgi:O-antigen/teichoic acid export membrane protein